ncbi:uncharacterized protein EI97DRAFT_436594 [Westerdykella ornata]|uniref:Uncharacterized protein n=1 Tax=Westerdykella ornata TaxID=318751 RepID=A0A6A6JA28_WESOR|nr:uncharacterized protein EI97DRAFT_436594 [Westerdykella ornata]KAF2272818.1 hypothetical protein EI97DRAFT_436594 [Westerdykella ornata]
MVCRTAGKLLLLLWALGATAQEPTVVAKPPKDYLVSGGPTLTGNDILVEPDGSNLKIFLGPDRASAFKTAVEADCGNMDPKCIESAKKALGMVPNEDGLQKKIAPRFVIAAAVAGISILIQWIYLTKHEKDYMPTAVIIPTPTAKVDQDAYATATGIVFKPSEAAEPTKVAVSGPAVTATPKVEPASDGDIVITLPPGNMQFWQDAAEHSICPRSPRMRRDDVVPTCLRLQTQSAIMAAILNGGLGGMELIRIPAELQIVGNQQLTEHITSMIEWAKTIKTLYSEADLRRLVQIIAIFIWQTFGKIDVAGDVLTIIEIELNRMTLKKGKVQVKTEEENKGEGCNIKIDPAKDIPGYDGAYQAILAAIAANPDWNKDSGDGFDDNGEGSNCPANDGHLSDSSMPKGDLEGYIKTFCKDVANSVVGKDPVSRSYKGELFTAWLSANKVGDDSCGGQEPKISEEDCVKHMTDGVSKCAKNDKVFGIDVAQDCIQYKITTDGSEDKNPPWDRSKERSCSEKLTEAPYQLFSGIFPAFCKDVGKDKLEKTLTNADYQKPSRKRAPPLNVQQFDGWKFKFIWTGGENCKIDCNSAFQELTGLCGTQVMAEKGMIDVGCGKYEYDIDRTDDKAHDKICFKEQKEVREDKFKWKWGQRDQMVDAIENTFCKLNFKDEKYKDGIVEEQYDHDHDTFKLRLEVKNGNVPSPEQCVEFLKELVDGCDHNDELNQHNLKWGGRTVHKSTGNVFEVVPTWERVARDKPNWECNTWATREQKENKGKDGKPLPDLIDDQMMKLQCVHQYYNMGWVTKAQDCGGHYNIILTGSNGYANSQDCWRYNFPCISDSIVNQNGVVLTGTHWAGSAGQVKNYLGIRCWIGFDNY